MKIISAMCLVAIIWLAPQEVFAGNELPWEMKLPFSSATIEYRVSGVENGSETLYIRKNGKERATYRDTITKMMGMQVRDSSIEFMTPDVIYTYDLQAGDGVKGANPQKYMIEEFGKLSKAEQKKVRANAQKMGASYAQGIGGKVEEKAVKILGYDCDRIEIMGGAVTYILHGTDIPLKIEVNMMGMKMITEATTVSKGKADPKFFEHPKGITAVSDPEGEKMARMMSQQVIESLKDPTKAQNPAGAAMRMPAMEKDMTDEDKAVMEQAGEMMKNLQNIFSQ